MPAGVQIMQVFAAYRGTSSYAGKDGKPSKETEQKRDVV